MRRLVLSSILGVLAAGCHRGSPSEAPSSVSEAARLGQLLDALVALPTPPSPDQCAQLDSALAELGGGSQARPARFAQAELARTCGDEAAWRALHLALGALGYLPSLARLANDAIERRDWDFAQAQLAQLAQSAGRGESRSELAWIRERIREVEAQLVHARWVDRGDPKDFQALERAAKAAILAAPRDLDARADLIRLYAEQSAISGDDAGPEPRARILAQVSEREARRVAADLGTASPRLELVSGFVRDLEGDRIAAVAAWTRALEINSALVEPCLWLGLAALEARDYDEAQAQLRRYVDVHPDEVEALLALAVATGRGGDVPVAEALLARVVALAPADPRPHWNAVMLREPTLWLDDVGTKVRRYSDALDHFAALAAKAGPLDCPERGAAGPDLACVRASEALRQIVENRHPQRVIVVEDYLTPIMCRGSGVDGAAMRDRLDQEERDYRARLLELERAAAAASVPAAVQTEGESPAEAEPEAGAPTESPSAGHDVR